MLQALRQDIHFALRQLARAPGFVIVASITLALGIGANTALFTIGNSILGRPLPEIRDASTLAWVTPLQRQWNMSYPNYRDLRDQNDVFEGVAAFGNAPMSLSSGGTPIKIGGSLVSGNYFTLLGVRMSQGRGFLPDEDAVPGRNPVVVISHALWQERFEGIADVVGRRITLNGLGYTVVGVAPPLFNGVEHNEPRSVWIPMAMAANAQPQFPRILEERGASWLNAVGRLKAGVSVDAANASLHNMSRRLIASDSATYARFGARTAPVTSGVSPADRDVYPLAALASAVTLVVLLIACANVSNMMLGRAVGRRREIAVRLSLGAARSRVVRQLLTESLLLAAVATVIGVMLAAWTTGLVMATIPVPLNVSPDARVLVFTALAAVGTTLLFGLVPALHATRSDVATALKVATVGSDRRRTRLQRMLVTTQVALSILLLVTSGMFLSSLLKATRIDVQFEASNRVIAASFDLGLQGYTPERANTLVSALRTRLLEQPGVEAVTFTNQVPMGERLIGTEYALETDRVDAAGGREISGRARSVYQSAIRPDYFRVLGIPLTQGRDFADRDAAGSEQVAIVSEDLARNAWPGENAVGRRISLEGADGAYLTVVGVAREALTMGVSERRRPTVYLPQRQHPNVLDFTVLVRAASDARPLASVIRETIAGLDRDVPVDGVQTLAQYRHDRTAEARLGSLMIAIFGALALLLATVGVYAVLAFSVSQRSKEIGIRIAVGAGRTQISRLVVHEGMRLTTVGVVIGLVLGAAATKALSSVFLGVQRSDALVFVSVAALLFSTALLATWLPARRAARIDPMQALRSE
jgi:predicted permease